MGGICRTLLNVGGEGRELNYFRCRIAMFDDVLGEICNLIKLTVSEI